MALRDRQDSLRLSCGKPLAPLRVAMRPLPSDGERVPFPVPLRELHALPLPACLGTSFQTTVSLRRCVCAPVCMDKSFASRCARSPRVSLPSRCDPAACASSPSRARPRAGPRIVPAVQSSVMCRRPHPGPLRNVLYAHTKFTRQVARLENMRHGTGSHKTVRGCERPESAPAHQTVNAASHGAATALRAVLRAVQWPGVRREHWRRNK